MRLISNDLTTFREQICRHLFKVDFKIASEAPFSASIETLAGAPEGMCIRCRHSPGAMFRDRELVKDGVDSVSLIFVERGVGRFEQLGRELNVRQGGAALVRNYEPAAVGSHRPVSCVAVTLLSDKLRSADISTPDQLFARPWAETPALKLLRSYIGCLSNIEASPEIAEAAGRHMVELVRIAAAEAETQPAHEELWQVRLAVALQTIARRFRDPDFDEQAAAAEQGISTRHLQKIFERACTRFTDCLNEARLEAAHRDILDPRYSEATILRIAMDVGYCDVSYFNRLFVRRYGETPSQIRKRSRRD